MSLSILIWLPAVIGLIAAVLPARLPGRVAALGSLVTIGVAISFVARFHSGAAACSSSPIRSGSSPWASTTSSASTGSTSR